MHKYLIGLLLLMSLSCARKPETPRHVILVTVDTLRADALSCYGSPYPATDVQHASSRGSAAGFTLDEIAAQGRRYADVFAPRGMTFPSIATLFTARSPIEHGALSNGDVLDGSFETMAERFKAAAARAAFGDRAGLRSFRDRFRSRARREDARCRAGVARPPER
jgi:hypothetical protein